jgi:hypothetical protein
LLYGKLHRLSCRSRADKRGHCRMRRSGRSRGV